MVLGIVEQGTSLVVENEHFENYQRFRKHEKFPPTIKFIIVILNNCGKTMLR